METRSVSLWKTLDWVTIVIYLLLIIGGWFSVCGASYDYGDRDFLDFSTRAGRQFVWIICSFGLGFILLMLEERMYDMFAYLIYRYDSSVNRNHFYCTRYERFPFVVNIRSGQSAAGGVCKICHSFGSGKVYECLFI